MVLLFVFPGGGDILVFALLHSPALPKYHRVYSLPPIKTTLHKQIEQLKSTSIFKLPFSFFSKFHTLVTVHSLTQPPPTPSLLPSIPSASKLPPHPNYKLSGQQDELLKPSAHIYFY